MRIYFGPHLYEAYFAGIFIYNRQHFIGAPIAALVATKPINPSETVYRRLLQNFHKNIAFEMVKVLPEGVMKVYFAEGNSTENHTRVPLIVEFPAGTAPVSGRGQLNKYGEIHFKTNHPVVKEVKLYVSFVVK